jgi:peptide/nickel transport system substrate-binding protein
MLRPGQLRRSGRRSSWWVLACSTAAAIALTACASNQPATTATVAQLTWGLSSTPATLFAPTNFSAPDSAIMGLIQDNLLVYTGDGKLVTSLAQSWNAPDDTTYVYTLRSGAKFSDGNAVTPADVIFSLQLQTDPKYGSQESTLFGNVDSVTASGNNITVKLKQPDTLWKWLPTHMGFYIYEQKDVTANLASYGTPQHPPIGSGPYMVKEFVSDSHITLVRNPNYWGTKPIFDSVVFQIIPDDNTRLLAMQRGDIQGAWNPPPAAFAQWSTAATISNMPAYIWRGLTLDMQDPPFDDIHVRRALYYATDRAGIAQGITAGLAKPSTALDDPALFSGIIPDATIQQGYSSIATFPFDITKAKAELALSKVPNGFNFTLNVPAGSSRSSAISQSIKQTWAQIGVNVTLNVMPGGPRFQLILDHGPHLGVQVIGNLPDVPDATELLWLYFKGDQAVKNGNNSSNLKDSQIDSLIQQALTETNPTKAATLDLQIQQLASQQVPIIPILWENNQVAIKKGWTVGPINAFSWSHSFVEAIHTS